MAKARQVTAAVMPGPGSTTVGNNQDGLVNLNRGPSLILSSVFVGAVDDGLKCFGDISRFQGNLSLKKVENKVPETIINPRSAGPLGGNA